MEDEGGGELALGFGGFGEFVEARLGEGGDLEGPPFGEAVGGAGEGGEGLFDELGVVGAGEGEGGEEGGEALGAGRLLEEHHEEGAGGDLVDGEADGIHGGRVGVEDIGGGEDAAELEDAGEGLAHAAELAVFEEGEGAVEEPVWRRGGGVGELAIFLPFEDEVGEDGAG